MTKKNKKIISVGIIGYGLVGKRRREFIEKNKSFKLIAVSDVTFKNSGVFNDGVFYFKNYQKLLETKIDAIFICMPNKMAPIVTKKALKLGMHVFCEKPPSRDVVSLEKVIEVEKLYPKLKLKYGFNHRYHDSIIHAKKLIESKKFGKIINIRGIYGKSTVIPFTGNWRSNKEEAGGGILLDQGIHLLDMVLFFCNQFNEVHSFVSNDFWSHEVEDNAYVLMRDNTGIVAMIHSSATEWRHKFRLEITLEKALVEMSGILSGTKSYGEEKLSIYTKKPTNENKLRSRIFSNYSARSKYSGLVNSFKEETMTFLNDNSWKKEIDEFAELIVNNKPVKNGNSKQALEVMKLVYKIYSADKKWFKK